MQIILISGSAEHGKDLTARLFRDEMEVRGKKVLIFHYADYLKFICTKYFGWDGKKDEKGREILQQVGTNIVRERDADFWVNSALSFFYVFAEDYDFILIPDTRFPNEISAMKQEFPDTISVNVVRLNYENSLTPEQRKHPSETALKGFKFDYTITSQSGLQFLSPEVDKFISHYEF